MLMTRKLIYLLCLLCPALSGCMDEGVLPGTVAALPGEEVSVKLVVSTDPYNAPSSGETRAEEECVISTVSTPDMDIELVKTPVTRAAGAIGTNVENAVYTFTLLQFDGTTRNAVLRHKDTYPCPNGVIETKDVILYTTESAQGSGIYVKNRFTVITNLEEGDFTDAMIPGSYTYGQLEDVCILKKENAEFPLNRMVDGKDLMVMFGITDASIEKVEGKQIGIALKRSVAKVTFNIKQDMVSFPKEFNGWDVTLVNLPGKSFLNSQGQKAIFPTEAQMSGTGGGYYSKQLTATDGMGDKLPITGLYAYIPVNLQHDVPSSTHFSRRDNAPPKGTYVQIMGKKIDLLPQSGGQPPVPVLKDYVIYQIFLGKNLSTDYSIYANYSLTYNITLKGQVTDDSNVVRLIPGYFSGELVAFNEAGIGLTSVTDNNAVKWQYANRIEGYFMDSSYPKNNGVEKQGETNLRWYVGTAFSKCSAISLMNGFTNTRMLQGTTGTYVNYPAAHASYAGTNGTSVAGSTDFAWYLPSIGELIGTWIATSSTASTLSPAYWSSTATSDGDATVYIITNQGAVETSSATDGTRHYVRSLRDPDKASNANKP